MLFLFTIVVIIWLYIVLSLVRVYNIHRALKLPIPIRYRKGNLRANQCDSIKSAKATLFYIQKLIGRPLNTTSILDYGCGVKFSQAILQYDIAIKSYQGIDIESKMITFLKKHNTDARFNYEVLDFHNEMYNPTGEKMKSESALPLNNKYDLITLQSIITHFNPEDTKAILQILRRYCEANGVLFFTCFIDNNQSQDFKDRFPEKPLLNAVYKESYLRQIIAECGWEVISFHPPNQQCFIEHHFLCRMD